MSFIVAKCFTSVTIYEGIKKWWPPTKALAALGTHTSSAAGTIETQWTGMEQQCASLQAISCYSDYLSALVLSAPKGWNSIGVCMSWDIWGTF